MNWHFYVVANQLWFLFDFSGSTTLRIVSAILKKSLLSMALCSYVILSLLLSIFINIFLSYGFFNIFTSSSLTLSSFSLNPGIRIYSSSMKFDFIIYGSYCITFTWQSRLVYPSFLLSLTIKHSFLWTLLHSIEQ